MTTTHTLTGRLREYLGTDLPGNKVQLTLDTNIPADGTLVDYDNDATYLHRPQRVTVAADGSFSIELIATDSTGTNVTDGSLRYILRAEFPDGHGRKRTWDSGYFEFTADLDLSDIIGAELLPPTFASEKIAEMEALLAEAAEITGLTGEDAAVALLLGDDESDTATAADGRIADTVVTNLSDVDSDISAGVNARADARIALGAANTEAVEAAATAAVDSVAAGLGLARAEEAVDLEDSVRGLLFEGDSDDVALFDLAEGMSALPGVQVKTISDASGWTTLIEGLIGRRTNGEIWLNGDLRLPEPFTRPREVPIVLVGDSLQANRFQYSDPVTSGILGRTIINRCVGGQTSDQVAGWFGGAPALATVDGGVIPASGSVALTTLTPNISQRNTVVSGSWSFDGLLAGVRGTLTVTKSSGEVYEYSFARAVAGDPVPCPAGSPFQTGFDLRHAIPFVRVGRNNFLTSTPAQMVAHVRSVLDWSDYGELAVVESIPPYNTETTGAANRTTLDAANAALAEAFPRQWLDTAAYLRSADTLTAMGVTPTTQDTDDIAAGITPTSFRLAGDPVHYNYLAYNALDRLYQSRLALAAA